MSQSNTDKALNKVIDNVMSEMNIDHVNSPMEYNGYTRAEFKRQLMIYALKKIRGEQFLKGKETKYCDGLLIKKWMEA